MPAGIPLPAGGARPAVNQRHRASPPGHQRPPAAAPALPPRPGGSLLRTGLRRSPGLHVMDAHGPGAQADRSARTTGPGDHRAGATGVTSRSNKKATIIGSPGPQEIPFRAILVTGRTIFPAGIPRDRTEVPDSRRGPAARWPPAATAPSLWPARTEASCWHCDPPAAGVPAGGGGADGMGPHRPGGNPARTPGYPRWTADATELARSWPGTRYEWPDSPAWVTLVACHPRLGGISVSMRKRPYLWRIVPPDHRAPRRSAVAAGRTAHIHSRGQGQCLSTSPRAIEKLARNSGRRAVFISPGSVRGGPRDGD
jgi:hypothetical protein